MTHVETAPAPSLFSVLGEFCSALWQDWPMAESPMKAQWVGEDPKHNQFSLSGVCPHCEHHAVFNLVTQPHVHAPVETGRVTPDKVRINVYQVWGLLRCPGCKGYICGGIVKQTDDRTITRYMTHYPLGVPRADVAEQVPVEIAPDFEEAQKCLSIGCYKASATMCRRTVQAVCRDLKANGKDLYNQLLDLREKNVITEYLKRVATAVRVVGKNAAHPLDETVSPSDAAAMIKFTREFLHHVYVVPAELDAYVPRDEESD